MSYRATEYNADQLNVKIYVNDVLVEGSGSTTIGNGDNVRIEAKDGFMFEKLDGQSDDTVVFFSGSGAAPQPLDVNEELTVATGVYQVGSGFNGYYRTLNLETVDYVPLDEREPVESIPRNIAGTNHVYLVDVDTLVQLSGHLNLRDQEDLLKFGKYILNVIQLPFSIPDEVIAAADSIVLGGRETPTQASVISTDRIKVDLGKIEVPKTNDNLLAFKNVDAVIYLPMIEPITLDAGHVIGETITISYLVDCYTGRATVNIHSSKIDDVIVTKQVDLGVRIPYTPTTDNDNVENNNIELGVDNGIKRPFIEIMQGDFVLADGFFTIPVADESTLSGQIGFIEVDEIDLSTNANYSEKEQIISSLADGVIIR